MIIFGAGVIGEATLYACRAAGVPVECFLDDRITGPVLGVPVLRTEDFKGDQDFLLTSPNIDDMIVRLRELGFANWRSCGEVLRDFDVSGIEFQSINGSNQESRYSIEHVKYLIRTCLHHHDNYMHPERLTVQSVDLMITERCSMKCMDCSNLMQYYEHPENADLDEMYTSMKAFFAGMDEIYEFRVIGGEPFMHKDIHTVIGWLSEEPKVKQVSIFTNATILPKAHQWEFFQNEKVRFFITDYDAMSRNIRPLVDALEERGIAYVSEKANGWTDCAALDKHGRSHDEQKKIWDQCCAKNLATLADGKLYRCPFAANAAKLRAVPDYRDDYIVMEKSGREDIRRFLREKEYIQTCDHCNGRSYGDKVIVPAIQTKAPLKYKKYFTLKEIAA